MNTRIARIYSVLTTLLLTFTFCAGCQAGMLIDVSISGQVQSNSLSSGALRSISLGETGVINFSVDSDLFLNHATFPTRGYQIDPASFTLSFGPTVVGLQDPFPAGETPYFTLRNNDPGVDGFFLSRNVGTPDALSLNEPGLALNFVQTYSRIDLLTSLEITTATGTYGTLDESFSNVAIVSGLESLELDFASMTVGTIPEPSSSVLSALAIGALLFRRNRRLD